VNRLRRRLRQVDGERGSALVEFVFIALVVFVPLVYIVAGFSAVQRGVFASTAAAREAGRAIATAPDPVTGQARAERAAELAVEDQSVDATDVQLAYASASAGAGAGAGAGCTGAGSYVPTLTPGEEFSVCVTVTVRIPLLPEFIDANTATGQFVVERDRYVDG
jgi:Flp pilus assembly protein TadG